MRHLLAIGVLVSIFALSGGTALATDNNDQRMAHAPLIPCRGLYNAGVGADPATRPTGGHTYGTPGYAHVFENDEEMCHHRAD